jgi:putative salt-induced outer membrane protein
MIRRQTWSVIVALALLAGPAHAAWNDVAKAQVAGGAPGADGTFSGKFELGYLATSGNTDTSSLNSKLAVGWEARKWRHSAGLGVVRAEDSGVLKTERFTASAKSDYKFNEFDYLFVTVNYDKDEFAGYARRTSEAVGYGRRLIGTPAHQLEAELGVGARQTEPVLGPDSDETILRLAGKYVWKFSAAGEFLQTVVMEKGGDNTYSESVSSLKAALTGRLGLKVSYTIKNNSDVLPGLERTDTATAVGIEYSF